jgi:hypothetical protein
MGDVADMLLDGTLCECCGTYIDDEGGGIPRYCSPQCAKDRGADMTSFHVPERRVRPPKMVRAMRWLAASASPEGVDKERAPSQLAWLAKRGLVRAAVGDGFTVYVITEAGDAALRRAQSGGMQA